MKNRQGFNSSIGMILATAGSAVGAGNIWRFSYVAGKSGGGAFLIFYLFMIFLIGMPLMISEIAIGRKGQKDAKNSFKQICPNKKWYHVGSLSILTSYIILGYYIVVCGWSLKYFVTYLFNGFSNQSTNEISSYFTNFIQNPIEPIIYTLIILFFTSLVVSKGVNKGIEKASNIVMPILFILLVVLSIKSLTLKDSYKGVEFLFKPDFKTFFNNKSAVLSAIGHSFFSLSIGMAIMITYGSYVDKKENLFSSVFKVALLDTLVAVISGLIIFPAVFSFGLEPSEGAGLVFVSLPNIFNSMIGGQFFGAIFFLLFTFAGLTSTISLLETSVSYLIDDKNINRVKSTILSSIGIFILSIISSLSLGNLSNIMLFGKNIFDFLDYTTSNILLLLVALLEVIFLGWFYSKKDLMDEVTNDGLYGSKIKNIYYFLIKYLMPFIIILIFLFNNGFIG